MTNLVLIVTEDKTDARAVPNDMTYALIPNIVEAKKYLKDNPIPTQIFINAKLTTEGEFNELQHNKMQYSLTRVAAYRSLMQLNAQLQMCPFVPPYTK